MFSEINLSVPLRDYLIGLERELGRPIYARSNRGRALVPDQGLMYYVQERGRHPNGLTHQTTGIFEGLDPEQYDPASLPPFTNENALILHSYGLFAEATHRVPCFVLPGEFYTDERARDSRQQYIVVDVTGNYGDESVLPDDRLVGPEGWVWAQSLPGEVAFAHTIEYMREPREVNWEFIIGRFLRSAADPVAAEERAERLRRQTEEIFAQIMNETHEIQHRERSVALDRVETENRRLVELLGQNVRELVQARHALAAIDAIDGLPPERIAQEWENLVNHPRITNVRAPRPSTLEITTDLLVLTNPDNGMRRTLGEFVVTLGLDRNRVTLRNLRGTRGGWYHPHVDGQGNACWGEIGPLIVELSAHREIVALIEVVIQYLESYNPRDSYGRHAAFWFNHADENPEFNTNTALPEWQPPNAAAPFNDDDYYDEAQDTYTFPDNRTYTYTQWWDQFMDADREFVRDRARRYLAAQERPQQTVAQNAEAALNIQ